MQVVVLGSATGTRTPVYGVRGRCPRPLDDSTLDTFSKASAKVQQKLHMTKYFCKKMHFLSKKVYFLAKLMARTAFFKEI